METALFLILAPTYGCTTKAAIYKFWKFCSAQRAESRDICILLNQLVTYFAGEPNDTCYRRFQMTSIKSYTL